MLKNPSSSQLLLIAIAAVLFILAGFSFYLLQNPSALLPLTPSKTNTPTPSSTAQASMAVPSKTSTPTRQTSYTPFATLLTPAISSTAGLEGGTITPQSSLTDSSAGLTPSVNPTQGRGRPTNTPSMTPSPTTARITSTPSKTATILPGEYGVTGRVLQNGTPVANVVVEFKDDVASRQASTNLTGHYWFTTLAPGTAFSLTFEQSNNRQLAPALEVSSLVVIHGNLPIGVNTIDLPDFEVSLNLDEMMFETSAPMDGTTYSASVIGPGNPIRFDWSLYFYGGSYHVELGPYGSDQPVWSSSQLAPTYFMWNGTLNDGTHITQGTYWWRVAVTRSLGNYVIDIYTQPWNIFFNP